MVKMSADGQRKKILCVLDMPDDCILGINIEFTNERFRQQMGTEISKF